MQVTLPSLSPPAGTTLVRCGALFDGTGSAPTRDATLVLERGRVAPRVAPGVPHEEIDLRPYFVMPGFVDAHSHVSIVVALGDQWAQKRRAVAAQALSAPSNLRRDLAGGTTTLRVMGEEEWIDLHVRDAIRSGLIDGPDLICAARPFAPSNGFGRISVGYDGVEEIRKVARENLHRGADFLKVFATAGAAPGRPRGGEYAPEELRAIVDEAERAGTYVAAHATAGPGLDDAVRAGVRTVEHAWGATERQIELMLEHGVTVVNTLAILFSPDGIEGGEPHRREQLVRLREEIGENVTRLLASGIPLALGTDHVHGAMPYEIQAAIRFGLSPLHALIAATSGGARAIGVDDRTGSLVPGKSADLIALDGNPLEDPTAVERVVYVMRAGRRLV